MNSPHQPSPVNREALKSAGIVNYVFAASFTLCMLCAAGVNAQSVKHLRVAPGEPAWFVACVKIQEEVIEEAQKVRAQLPDSLVAAQAERMIASRSRTVYRRMPEICDGPDMKSCRPQFATVQDAIQFQRAAVASFEKNPHPNYGDDGLGRLQSKSAEASVRYSNCVLDGLVRYGLK